MGPVVVLGGLKFLFSVAGSRALVPEPCHPGPLPSEKGTPEEFFFHFHLENETGMAGMRPRLSYYVPTCPIQGYFAPKNLPPPYDHRRALDMVLL